MDRRIVDYKIIKGTPEAVTVEVNALIKENWQPLGPAQNIEFDNGYRVLQTLVKYFEPTRGNSVIDMFD